MARQSENMQQQLSSSSSSSIRAASTSATSSTHAAEAGGDDWIEVNDDGHPAPPPSPIASSEGNAPGLPSVASHDDIPTLDIDDTDALFLAAEQEDLEKALKMSTVAPTTIAPTPEKPTLSSGVVEAGAGASTAVAPAKTAATATSTATTATTTKPLETTATEKSTEVLVPPLTPVPSPAPQPASQSSGTTLLPATSSSSSTDLKPKESKEKEEKSRLETAAVVDMTVLKNIPQKFLQFWFTSEGRAELFGFIDYTDVKAEEVKARADHLKNVHNDKAIFIRIRDTINYAVTQGLKAQDFASKEFLDSHEATEMDKKIDFWRRHYKCYVEEAEKCLRAAAAVSMTGTSASVTAGISGLRGPGKAASLLGLSDTPPLSEDALLAQALEESRKEFEQNQGKRSSSSGEGGATSSHSVMKPSEVKSKAEVVSAAEKKSQSETESTLETEEELLAAMEASQQAYITARASSELVYSIGISASIARPSERPKSGSSSLAPKPAPSPAPSSASTSAGKPASVQPAPTPVSAKPTPSTSAGDVSASSSVGIKPPSPTTGDLSGGSSAAEQKKALEAQVDTLKKMLAEAEAKSYIDYMAFQQEKSKAEAEQQKQLVTLRLNVETTKRHYTEAQEKTDFEALTAIYAKFQTAEKALTAFNQTRSQQLKIMAQKEAYLNQEKREIARQQVELQALIKNLGSLEVSIHPLPVKPVATPVASTASSAAPTSAAPKRASGTTSGTTSVSGTASAMGLGPVASAVASVFEPLPTPSADLLRSGGHFDFGSTSSSSTARTLSSSAFEWQRQLHASASASTLSLTPSAMGTTATGSPATVSAATSSQPSASSTLLASRSPHQG